MTQTNTLLTEMEQEAQTTRKLLERVPDDKFDWQPHSKSMTLVRLATHVAELPGWVTLALTTNEIDFATAPYEPQPIRNRAELLDYFETTLADGRQHLTQAADAQLANAWTVRDGAQVYWSMSKGEAIRHAYCQIVHHRAQLGVYLRLLDIPIPGSYGPSADEM